MQSCLRHWRLKLQSITLGSVKHSAETERPVNPDLLSYSFVTLFIYLWVGCISLAGLSKGNSTVDKMFYLKPVFQRENRP